MILDTLELKYNNGVQNDVCDESPLLDETERVTFVEPLIKCIKPAADLRSMLTVQNNSLRPEVFDSILTF